MASRVSTSLSTCVFVFLTVIGAANASAEDQPHPPVVSFDSAGKLSGQPPIIATPGSRIRFTITVDPEKGLEREVAGMLVKAAAGLGESTAKRSQPTYLLLGLQFEDLKAIRAAYCFAASALITKVSDPATKDDLDQERSEACTGVQPTKNDSLLPTFVVAADLYRLDTSCRDTSSARTSNRFKTEGEYTLASVTAPEGCREFRYELRRERPAAAMANAWLAAHPMSDALRAAVAEARDSYTKPPERFEPSRAERVHAVLDAFKPLDDCLAKHLDEQAEIIKCTEEKSEPLARKKLNDARAKIDAAQKDVSSLFTQIIAAGSADFARNWLWFTAGTPTLHPLPSTPAELSSQLDAKKATLSKQDAQLATIDKLISGNVKVEIRGATELLDLTTKVADMRAKRADLAEDIDSLTRRITSAGARRTGETFLYDGSLFLSNGTLVMQHHDAGRNFVVMGTPASEIREDQQLVVLAENVAPSTQLSLTQTVTAITRDVSAFTSEVALTAGAGAPFVAEQAKLPELARHLRIQYDSLRRGVAFADAELTTVPILERFAEASDPVLVSRVVPHDIPHPAPANVAYTIKQKDGTADKDVGSGTYRINRLYRSRFRLGLLYSTLETQKVGEDADHKPTLTVTKHGVDALFGVQTFLGQRRDPRSITPSNAAWSLLAALTARNPTENLLVGLGYEPWGGVSFTFGGHLGRTEEPRTPAPGKPSVEDKWIVRPLLGITFDVDFFKQLFAMKPAI
jgi:hypothetical protein